MDAQFVVPIIGRRFGLDGLLGLVPGVGDAATGAISLYVVWEARRMGAPSWLITRMLANVAMDVAGGLVPLVGDVFDLVFKANLRNIALLEEWLARTPRA